ncbi:hypothetical protein [Klebsiella michiganensis]
MSLEKEIVPKGDYHSSLEVIIENCYAASTGKLVVYLEGGHFNRQFGADEFALNTLSDAVAFGKKLISKYQKNIKLVYGILVDDLGIACSEDSCTLSQLEKISEPQAAGELPEEIEFFIQKNTLIKRDKLMVFSERTSKNRSIESIKKKLKDNTEGLLITENGSHTEIKLSVPDVIPFVLARKNGDVFTAKCPAIIFQHYKDILFKLKQRFTESRDFVIIDWSDFSDHNKVVQGRTALTVMQKPQNHNLTIANIFFGDDEGHIAKMEYSAVSSIKADPMVV